VKVNPVLQHPVLIFSFPYFIILLFSFAGNDFSKAKKWLLILFLAAGVSGTTLINKYYSKQHFGEFKDVARLTAQWQQKYSDTAITKVININNPLYIDYYLERNQAKVRFDLYKIDGQDGLRALSETVRNSRTPYFLYAITKPTPAEGEDIVRSAYPFIVEMKNYEFFSSVVLFSRIKGDSYETANQLTEIKRLKAILDADTLQSQIISVPTIAHQMDSLSEYSPGMEMLLDEFGSYKNLVFEAGTDLFTPAGSGESVLVISIETADGKSLQWKGAASSFVEVPGKWCRVINTLRIGSGFPKGAKLKVYFWNKDKKLMYIRDLQCRIFNAGSDK
jgi:hypothetical protein